jgi:hypothetical protein
MYWFRSCARKRHVAASALLLVIGCGGNGTVTGKVTLNGQPVPGGLVSVIPDGPDTEQFSAPSKGKIERDGTYTVVNVPKGKAKITVITAKTFGSISHPDAIKDPFGPYMPIPDIYKDPAKTPLALEVARGKQEFNIAMTGEVPDEKQQ